MPKMWYDIHSVIVREGDDEETVRKKEYNRQIIADRKPYFMIYIYPQLKREYKKFMDSAKRSCQIQFGIRLDELLKMTNRNERQEEFVKWYYKKYPVSDENGVMNRLCHYVEQEFDGYVKSVKVQDYDYKELLVSERFGTDYIGKDKIDRIKKLFSMYKEYMQNLAIIYSTQYIDGTDKSSFKCSLNEWFKRELDDICVSIKKQCDILLKLCYSNEQSKRFVWSMCGEQIVKNLLEKNHSYSYFVADEKGEVQYKGERYKKFITIEIKDEEYAE